MKKKEGSQSRHGGLAGWLPFWFLVSGTTRVLGDRFVGEIGLFAFFPMLVFLFFLQPFDAPWFRLSRRKYQPLNGSCLILYTLTDNNKTKHTKFKHGETHKRKKSN